MGSGCASVMSPPSYSIPVSSEPSGATVNVINEFDNSVVATTITPGEVSLQPQAGFLRAARYEFQFEKEGYKGESVGLYSDLNDWLIMDIPCGLIYFTPLLMAIDAAHGSMYELRGSVSATLSPVQPRGKSPEAREVSITGMPRVPAADKGPKVAVTSEVVNTKSYFKISAHVEDDPAKGEAILGNGDGRIQKGEAFDLVVVISNVSTAAMKAVTCTVILPDDKSIKAFSGLCRIVSELASGAATTNRFNLVMPLNAKVNSEPVCSIEVSDKGTQTVVRSEYSLPVDSLNWDNP